MNFAYLENLQSETCGIKVTADYVSNHKDVEVAVNRDSNEIDSTIDTLVLNYPFSFYITDIRKKVVLAAGKVIGLEEIKFDGDNVNPPMGQDTKEDDAKSGL